MKSGSYLTSWILFERNEKIDDTGLIRRDRKHVSGQKKGIMGLVSFLVGHDSYSRVRGINSAFWVPCAQIRRG